MIETYLGVNFVDSGLGEPPPLAIALLVNSKAIGAHAVTAAAHIGAAAATKGTAAAHSVHTVPIEIAAILHLQPV